MSETTGEILSAKDRLDRIDQILDEYENQKLGLPNYEEQSNKQKENNIGKYLEMGRDQLEKLDAQECGYISHEILSYSFFIQRSINREKSRCSWSKSVLKNYVVPKFDQIQGWGFDEKCGKIIAQDEFAQKIDSINRYATQRVERLDFLANGLKSIADNLNNIARSKGNKQYDR